MSAVLANIAVVIPAFRPERVLCSLVRELAAEGFYTIVVIDDGSGDGFAPLFADVQSVPQVILLRHAVNLGKGTALKTGINHVLCSFPNIAGVVTADADGQHAPADIRKVAERLAGNPSCVVLGARTFDGHHVPARSRFGNRISRVAVRLLLGHRLSDTQTGLRGVPASFLPHLLRIRSTGYEFELDMLIACKHQGYPIVEQPIRTIYSQGNRSSHFNPLLDSLRIYFVLLRFGFVSLLTAILDNVVFVLALLSLGSIAQAQTLGRAAATAFNYIAARRAVFLSREQHRVTLSRYLLLVGISGVISYALIQLLLEHTSLPPVLAKLAAEATLFIANFAIQREFVFKTSKPAPAATDWDRYYRNVFPAARLTRTYTSRVIAQILRRYCGASLTQKVMVELGGANSCFLDRIVGEFRPGEYHVIDTNQHGLDLLDRRLKPAHGKVVLHREDCRKVETRIHADVAFSIGLVEHFSPEDTRNAILAHFDLLKPGGWMLVSFPTPTWLYRTARALINAVGQWRFPDERPLERTEVLSVIRERGVVLHEQLLWPLVLTQHIVLARKESVAD